MRGSKVLIARQIFGLFHHAWSLVLVDPAEEGEGASRPHFLLLYLRCCSDKPGHSPVGPWRCLAHSHTSALACSHQVCEQASQDHAAHNALRQLGSSAPHTSLLFFAPALVASLVARSGITLRDRVRVLQFILQLSHAVIQQNKLFTLVNPRAKLFSLWVRAGIAVSKHLTVLCNFCLHL